ncbi:MAG: ABC transporter ATP-binding protein [Acidimicrobiales bacterium]|nr:multidrug ABC transporter ATP-binding protein [Acidimicrobiaceae bacterium]MDP6077422.1 ABC transporter ATP-binding protein [Acidimicrobiales bacterium]HCV36642.1 ABC transporter ATP-binding protein [Acidimicrobiaceae bacterium]HJO79363.1 ABC transporter ATP-binding protein [Acidimicrobiales bacterium]
MSSFDGHDVLGPAEKPEPRALDDIADAGALSVLRRGLAASPELRAGLTLSVLMTLSVAGGRLIVPLVIQFVLDRGFIGGTVRLGLVLSATGGALALTTGSIFLGQVVYKRLVGVAEAVLLGLRVRTFAHLHRLSLADHTSTKTGVLTARVTSDVEALAKFAQWGAISWIVNSVQIVAVVVVMAAYSWQLTIVTVLVHLPLLPVLRDMQKRQLRAYDLLRTRVGETMGVLAEVVHGIELIRTYGQRETVRRRLHRVIDVQYRQQMRAARYFSLVLPCTDIFGVAAVAVVIGTGVHWGSGWGVTSGELVAFVFLVNMLIQPINSLGETLDQTQTALAGWWKILDVLDTKVEVGEPPAADIRPLPPGALPVAVRGVEFSYRGADRVLHGIDVDLEAGSSVAVVGETGSGKTTFAMLLARLADPTVGQVMLGGIDLRSVSANDRRRSVRMVPQDGFLFDTTIGENIRFGLQGSTEADVHAAVVELGLGTWVAGLTGGLDTRVGEKGSSLSVGERQLVALLRAQLADPGLLILDEATSAVDPDTEQTLERALERLAEGRTTVSVAHRLSTAERSDLVLVFDDGRIVESGPHVDLATAGGIYANLYESWLGNTRVLDS